MGFGVFGEVTLGGRMVRRIGVFQIGKIAGSIVVVVLKGMQLALPESDDQSGRRWIRKFGDSMAHGSSLTALNEMAVWMC